MTLAMSWNISSAILLYSKHNLSRLMLIPEALQKVLSITSKAIYSYKVPVPNKITSSTNRRWVRVSEEAICIPRMRPWSLALDIKRLRPSMTRIKSSGDRGQPCLMPREAEKNFEGVPLTRTTKFAEVRHPMIQLTTRRGAPICIKMRRTKYQLTRLKALIRSNLRMKAHIFLVLIEWRVS